ncbi:MAG: hypothetical protein RJA16_322 [Planctomycetota bacterium]|jgi:hypothetical protein
MIALRPVALRLLTAFLAGAFSIRASAQCPAEGDCYTPHEGGGCIQTACCELVCEFDALCCDASWDEFCVATATELCVGIACPNPGPCEEPHENAGCEREECCDFVCRLDPFCCFTSWDGLCAERAALCDLAPCAIEIPATAIAENEPCYQRLNDGCNLDEPVFATIACGESIAGKWTSNVPRDVDWFRVAEGVASVSIRPEFPAFVQLVRGACEDSIEILAEASTDPCLEAAIEIDPAWRGDPTLAVVVSGGTVRAEFRRAFACDEIDPENPPSPEDPPPPDPPFERRYLLAAECGCPIADLDGDCTVGGADLAILLSAWGTSGGIADLDGNGLVDGADLTLLLSFWG